MMLGLSLILALATEVAAEPPTQEIWGGTDVATCNWPTTVSMEGGCTGTLVHPQVVIYAAHCGSFYSSVQFGEAIEAGASRSVNTQFCSTFPGGNIGGDDFAVCVLEEPQMDIPIVPILMGCETEVLTPGREVTIVGFGNANTGPYGIKREVTTTINEITIDDEAFIGGGGLDSCQGDSGGPVYVRLPEGEGYDGSWRVFGITSYGGACGTGGYYAMMHIGMDWFESESGIDLTPCHDADGTWNPGPECGSFPFEPQSSGGSWNNGCDPGPLSGFSSSCGMPYDIGDEEPPSVAISAPTDGAIFDTDPMTGTVDIQVDAIAEDNETGIDTVELLVNGMPIPMGVDPDAPYTWTGTYSPGIYTFQAVATDLGGNVAQSQIVEVGVDQDPEGEDESGDGGSSGADDMGGTTGDLPGGTAGGDATDTSAGADGGDDGGGGLGCRSGGPSAPTGWMLGLLGLAMLRRRRA